MSAAKGPNPASTILKATGRADLADAIAWIAEGHPLPAQASWPRLLRALIEEFGDGVNSDALRRATREVASSDLDTSRVVFDPKEIQMPDEFERALEALLSRSSDGGFGGLTARSVMRAQRAEPLAIQALCLAAGVTEGDARDWFGVSGAWREEQVGKLLDYLGKLVAGELESPVPRAIPARALELIDREGGWEAMDKFHAKGVPYAALLAQRAAGGVWLANKNRTSNHSNQIAAGEVCDRLADRGIDFRRATTAGGNARQKDLQELSGVVDKRVGVVVVDRKGRPTFAITFSTANDGGTARANGDGLLQIPRTDLSHALMLVGRGWADRHETDRLALHFAGFLFSDRSIGDLVAAIEQATE